MTALRAKFIRDLTVRGRAQRTQRSYIKLPRLLMPCGENVKSVSLQGWMTTSASRFGRLSFKPLWSWQIALKGEQLSVTDDILTIIAIMLPDFEKVGLNVAMRSLNVLMAQPQGDYCDVHSRLQQMKSACMTKQVGTNVFTAETRTTCDGSLGGLLQNVVNTVARQR